MEFCTSCGDELGVGRFCTNCGHPIDAPPPPPRSAVPPNPPTGTHRGRPPWLPWAMLGAILLLVAVVGIVLLTGRDDTTPTATPQVKPGDVARFATATVPDTAPPNLDVDGNQVRYEARNMLDGVPETCWRMPGDGSGSEITIQLAEPTVLSRVGLINGYAKSATGADGSELNWYTGNRRIQAVEWVFDDGTVLSQNLTETRQMQSIEVDEIVTSTIRLRLLSVSAPGTGQAARDYTAISDLTIVGVSGG